MRNIVIFVAVGLLWISQPAIGYLVAEEPDAIRGLIPVIRLFCAPCFDRYAQEYRPRTLTWQWRNADDIARSRVWTRAREASLAIPALPDRFDAAADDAIISGARLTLLIDDAEFDPAQVYVFVDQRWINLAWYLGLPEDRALPTLSDYIRVERAPPQGDPGPDPF